MSIIQPDMKWISTLFRLGMTISREMTQGVDWAPLIDHIIGAFEAKTGCLALANDDGNSLTIIAGIGLPEHVIGNQVPFERGVLGWVAENRKPLLLNGDIASDPRFNERLAKDRDGSRRRPSSAMCWPLLTGEDLIGVMSINRGEDQPMFTDEDLSNGFSIIQFIAMAVDNAKLHQRSVTHVAELRDVIGRLEEAQNQLLQSEKMASIGQLAAGVAHEINNPVGFVSSNLNTLGKYVDELIELVASYDSLEQAADPGSEALQRINALKKKIDLEFIQEDLPALIAESLDGADRVKKIVQNLKEFSHVDSAERQWADLHAGLDSTLNIVHNEIKYKAEVVKEYGDIPQIECVPSQVNQVFMNMLVNAAQAIEEQGVITVRTGCEGDAAVWVEIADTGKGIDEAHLNKVFEPFFTTKPVGKGTGLGLSLSYSIIEKHGGHIGVESSPGKGTTFRIHLPIRMAAPDVKEAG